MILLQLRIIFRSLRHTRLNSAITILGLTVGMTATLLLFTYAHDELSYDRFHERSERIYRINSVLTYETDMLTPLCIGLQDSILQKQVPEIEEVLQIKEANSLNETEFTFDNQRFKNIRLIYSDPNIHKVFKIRYLRGNPEVALSNPKSVVLTRTLSLKIFGSIDILEKSVLLWNKPYTVTGVIEDYPSASHLKIDAIIPLKAISNIYNEGCELNTYVLFRNNINPSAGVNKTIAAYNKLLAQHFSGQMKTNGFLQKLTDIHLKSGFQSRGGINTEYKKVLIYLTLALVVLVIAIINFINLLTAQYEGKLRDIGIQKAIGGTRRQIIFSFLAKSLIFSFISLIFAAFLANILIPRIGRVLNHDLISTYHNNLTLFVVLPVLALVVGLFSGIYPALFISRFTPDNLIKRNLSITGRSSFTRILVVLQFSIMIFLMISLLVMKKQITFMKNADLGINSKGVIAITDVTDKLGEAYQAIKNELKSIPDIEAIGASHHLFGNSPSGQRVVVIGNGPGKEFPIKQYRALPGFFETLGFRFTSGRPFDENIKTDETAVILNETAVRLLGLADPINTRIFKNDTLHIIGVVKDFHFSSLEESIEPMMLTYDDNINNIMLKVSDNNIRKVLEQAGKIIKQFDPDYTMNYVILEDYCRNRYGTREQMETLSTYAAIISLLLAMLGLYALTAIMVQKRSGEIALRKINGATRKQVVKLLISTYVKQVLIAYFIAVPVAWYVTHVWLNNFAYKTRLSWWIFILTGVISLIITLLTVSWQSWGAATKNPVDSLRFE